MSPIFQSLIATNELLQLQDRHWRSLLQPTGLAGMPSTGYLCSAVALRWYYIRQVSRASWLPLQTMVRNEVFRDHPLRKIITLHPAIPQGLLDAALNRTFKAFTVLFLMLLEVTSNLRVSWQQLLACCALPDRMILLELLPIASVMMAAG